VPIFRCKMQNNSSHLAIIAVILLLFAPQLLAREGASESPPPEAEARFHAFLKVWDSGDPEQCQPFFARDTIRTGHTTLAQALAVRTSFRVGVRLMQDAPRVDKIDEHYEVTLKTYWLLPPIAGGAPTSNSLVLEEKIITLREGNKYFIDTYSARDVTARCLVETNNYIAGNQHILDEPEALAKAGYFPAFQISVLLFRHARFAELSSLVKKLNDNGLVEASPSISRVILNLARRAAELSPPPSDNTRVHP